MQDDGAALSGQADAPVRTGAPAAGRPQGEIRTLMVSALRERGPMPMRDLAQRTQIGYSAARWTIARCVAAGVLVKAGQEKRAHSRKWVALYDVQADGSAGAGDHGAPWTDLGRCISAWAR